LDPPGFEPGTFTGNYNFRCPVGAFFSQSFFCPIGAFFITRDALPLSYEPSQNLSLIWRIYFKSFRNLLVNEDGLYKIGVILVEKLVFAVAFVL
jgi:hypothetical protein